MSSGSIGYNIAHIPKLDGCSNYDTWKILVTSSLESSGVWKHVDGSAVPPIQHPDECDYAYQDRLELFHTKAAQACNIVLSTSKQFIQHSLKSVITAKLGWDKLAMSYESEGLVHVQQIWLDFAHGSYNGGSIEQFCAKYRAALDKCTSAEIIIS